MRSVPIVLLALMAHGLVCAGYGQTDGAGKPQRKAQAPRSSTSGIVWPSWLPELSSIV